jgi:hypothetical protein
MVEDVALVLLDVVYTWHGYYTADSARWNGGRSEGTEVPIKNRSIHCLLPLTSQQHR